MRILHVIPSLEIGGAQRLIVDLLPILYKKNKDTSLLVFNKINSPLEQIIEHAGINFINLGISSYKNPIIIFKLFKIIRQYDIIHAHLFPTLYWVAFASIFTHNKIVYTEHSTKNKRRTIKLLRPIEICIYNLYSKIISISKQTQDNLTTWLKKEGRQFIVIENGINLQRYKSENTYNTSPHKNLIMISRFAKSKDHETVIKSLQHIDQSINLILVGEGETLEHCKNLVSKLKLNNRISFLGSRTDIPQLIANSYIGIQSSHWEGFGLTAVEIMASNKPIIASDVNGLKQVVDGAGLLFKCGNEIELAKHINSLLEDKEYYDLITHKCFLRSQKYSIENMANKYYELYKEILKA